MNTLRLGMRGAEVLLAQHLLIDALRRDPEYAALTPDAVFGDPTLRAVRLMRKRHGLDPAPGIVDLPVWRLFGVQFRVVHQVKLRPAETPDDGLHACLAMLRDPVPDGAVDCAKAVLRRGASVEAEALALARILGFAAVRAEAPFARQMLNAISHGPALLVGNTRHGRHCVVVTALWSRANLMDDGTIVRTLDSLPVGYGTDAGTIYPSMTVRGTDFRPEWILSA